MSFSSEVKDELARQISEQEHCNLAELAGIIGICGQVSISEEETYQLMIQTENVAVARKYFTLLKKIFNIKAEIRVRKNTYLKDVALYRVLVASHEDAVKVLQATQYLDGLEIVEDVSLLTEKLLEQECCKQAYLRGIFLTAGSICDPEKSYHLEMTFSNEPLAEQVRGLSAQLGIEMRTVMRKNNYVVYLKECLLITQLLERMGAGATIMSFEGVRTRREISNNVNRQVNCETANLSKTVQAAMKQIEDIRYIEQEIGFGKLSKGLKEVAILRIQYQDASLKELGQMLDPPVGKSGVNHRLHKLSELAEELRQKRGEEL